MNCMFAKRYIGAAFLVWAACMAQAEAGSISLNFNDFTANPAARVAIGADGSTAVFSEDPVISPISLSSLNVAVPANGMSLSFGYELSIPANNEDYFDVYIGNLSAPIFSRGGDGPALITGTPLFDLTSYAGGQVAIVFQLMAGFGDQELTSQLRLVNPRINLSTIDEPGTLFLVTFGVLTIFARCRVFYRHKARS